MVLPKSYGSKARVVVLVQLVSCEPQTRKKSTWYAERPNFFGQDFHHLKRTLQVNGTENYNCNPHHNPSSGCSCFKYNFKCIHVFTATPSTSVMSLALRVPPQNESVIVY